MQANDNISKSPSPALFVTRGNKVQLFNYETEQVLKEVVFESNPELFELKTSLSHSKKFYMVYSSSEYALLDQRGDVIFRDQEKGICSFKFLPKTDRYLVKITKKETEYTLTVYLLNGAELIKLEKVEISFFKPNFGYIKYDPKSGVFAIQTAPNVLELYVEEKDKLFLENEHKEDLNIVDFEVRKGVLYIVADDVKDDKPTISVSVYRTEGKIVQEYKRVFNNVQEVKLIVSEDGKTTLANAHRFVDTTGNSYYGLEKVFYYNQSGKVFDEVSSFKGSIHDVRMDPSESYFIVISGSVPSYTVLYDTKNSALFMMSHDFRNQIHYAPNQAFVAIAGFGSLNGEIEIWNYRKKEQIGHCTSSFASFLKWSSDSQYFMTAVVVEKLKVDHRFCVFSYNGTLLKKINLKVFDLINVDFIFSGNTDTSIIENPQKRAKTTGGTLIKNKVEAQKIDNEKIKNYAPGELNLVKIPNKPSLTVGNGSNSSNGGSTGLFFNSKNDGERNKFKVQKKG